MIQPTSRELEPIGDYRLTHVKHEPNDPGWVVCDSEALPLNMTIYLKGLFYGLEWPTSIEEPQQVVDVIRSATDQSGANEFTCIAYKPADEQGPEVSERKDGNTLDEVLMLDNLRLLRGNAKDRSLLWERNWPISPDRVSFAWLADIAVNATPICEVVEETIDPIYRQSVVVALDSLNAAFQKYHEPLAFS